MLSHPMQGQNQLLVNGPQEATNYLATVNCVPGQHFETTSCLYIDQNLIARLKGALLSGIETAEMQCLR